MVQSLRAVALSASVLIVLSMLQPASAQGLVPINGTAIPTSTDSVAGAFNSFLNGIGIPSAVINQVLPLLTNQAALPAIRGLITPSNLVELLTGVSGLSPNNGAFAVQRLSNRALSQLTSGLISSLFPGWNAPNNAPNNNNNNNNNNNKKDKKDNKKGKNDLDLVPISLLGPVVAGAPLPQWTAGAGLPTASLAGAGDLEAFNRQFVSDIQKQQTAARAVLDLQQSALNDIVAGNQADIGEERKSRADRQYTQLLNQACNQFGLSRFFGNLSNTLGVTNQAYADLYNTFANVFGQTFQGLSEQGEGYLMRLCCGLHADKDDGKKDNVNAGLINAVAGAAGLRTSNSDDDSDRSPARPPPRRTPSPPRPSSPRQAAVGGAATCDLQAMLTAALNGDRSLSRQLQGVLEAFLGLNGNLQNLLQVGNIQIPEQLAQVVGQALGQGQAAAGLAGLAGQVAVPQVLQDVVANLFSTTNSP